MTIIRLIKILNIIVLIGYEGQWLTMDNNTMIYIEGKKKDYNLSYMFWEFKVNYCGKTFNHKC